MIIFYLIAGFVGGNVVCWYATHPVDRSALYSKIHRWVQAVEDRAADKANGNHWA